MIMELIHCIPWVRFADNLRFVQQRGPSKTYDCRMLYTLKGEASLEMDGNVYTLRHGCAVLFQPGTTYCIRPSESITLTVLDFDFTQDYTSRVDFLLPCPPESFQQELAHEKVTFTDAPELNKSLYLEKAFFLEPTLQSIVFEFQNKHAFFQGKVSTLFKDALFEVIRALQGGKELQNVMGSLQQYIDSNISRHITNKELGELTGYNANYLNRLVLGITGMSLHQYILQRRLTLATGLLVTTKQPISEIAINLGFHSASHFSGFFKKATGITPAQCRKSGAL
jgi:AraC-like DNA-binding protein